MKKNTPFSAVLIALLFLTACKKTEETTLTKPLNSNIVQTKEGQGLNDYAMTTEDVVYEHNMLVFKDYDTYYKIVNSLINLREDDYYYEQTLSHLGFDPNAEDAEENEPYHPILKRFEDRFSGFNSLRKKVEVDEITFLDNGGDPADFPEHWLSELYLQTCLNEEGEICIGEHVFKIIDENNILLLTQQDWSLYEELEGLSPEDIDNSPQQNVVLLNSKSHSDNSLFEKLQSEECRANFTSDYNYGNGTLTLRSTSLNVFSSLSNTNYEWRVNGVLEHSGNGNQAMITPALSIPSEDQNGDPITYTIELTISNNLGCISIKERELVFNGCPDPSFDIIADPDNSNRYIFQAENLGPNVTYNWTAWDHSSSRNNVNFVGIPSPANALNSSFFFPNNNSGSWAQYYVDLNVIATGVNNCSNTITKNVIVECGFKNRNHSPTEVQYANNDRRVTGRIKQTNFLWVHSLRAVSKHYRQRNNGNWKRDRADFLDVGFTGGVYREKAGYGGGGAVCNTITQNNNVSSFARRRSMDRTISENRTIYVRPQDLSSQHQAREGSSTSPIINYTTY